MKNQYFHLTRKKLLNYLSRYKNSKSFLMDHLVPEKNLSIFRTQRKCKTNMFEDISSTKFTQGNV